MANRKRGVLWIVALIVALISAAVEIGVLVVLWPQLESAGFFAGLAVAAWALAGIVGTLGRFLPPYLSFIFLAGIAIVLVLLLIGYWFEWSRARIASFANILFFTLNAGLFLLFALGPSVSAWLLGLHKRTGRRAQLQLSTVFE